MGVEPLAEGAGEVRVVLVESTLDPVRVQEVIGLGDRFVFVTHGLHAVAVHFDARHLARLGIGDEEARSEEHTSELQSLMRISYAVFCLKKKKKLILHTAQ